MYSDTYTHIKLKGNSWLHLPLPNSYILWLSSRDLRVNSKFHQILLKHKYTTSNSIYFRQILWNVCGLHRSGQELATVMLWSPALFHFKVQSPQLFGAPLCMIQQPPEPNPYNPACISTSLYPFFFLSCFPRHSHWELKCSILRYCFLSRNKT